MQTAQNDAARLSSMVLKFHYFPKKCNIKILRFEKRGIITKCVFGHETARERSVSNEDLCKLIVLSSSLDAERIKINCKKRAFRDFVDVQMS